MSDLIPNQGDFYVMPKDEERERALDKERAEVAQILPMLEDTIEWFETQAQEFEKLTAIDLTHPKLSAESQIHGLKFGADALRKKKGEFQSYMNTYKKQ